MGVHLSASCRTTSSALRAERRSIPNFTEIFRRDQDCAHKSGCVARKAFWRPLACRCGLKSVRFLDRTHEVHIVVRETSGRTHVVREAADQHSSQCQTCLFVTWSLFQHVGSSSEEGEAWMAHWKTQARQWAKTERHFISSGGWRVQGQKARKVGLLVAADLLCKLRTKKRPYTRSSWVHAKAFGKDFTERSRRSHCVEVVRHMESFTSCAQVCFCASINENSGCKGSGD